MSLYSDFVVNIVREKYFAGVSGDYAQDASGMAEPSLMRILPWTGSVHGRAVRRNLENADKEV
mgnify:CR=1 FL=1